VRGEFKLRLATRTGHDSEIAICNFQGPTVESSHIRPFPRGCLIQSSTVRIAMLWPESLFVHGGVDKFTRRRQT
jgi:hypothetical protein